MFTGNYDPVFDGDGILVVDFSAGNDDVNNVHVDANYIYLFGRQNTGLNRNWRLEKRRIGNGAL